MKITGYQAYVMYLAMKSHFTQDKYDYIKYQGKVRASEDAFMNRRDKFYFDKLAKTYEKEELEDFLIANMMHGFSGWIGQLFEQESVDRYKDYTKVKQSLTYTFSKDLDHMLNKVATPKDLFTMDDKWNVAPIMRFYDRAEIHLETMAILDVFINFSKKYDARLEDDFLWQKTSKAMRKIRPFLKVDKEKIVNILKEKINNA